MRINYHQVIQLLDAGDLVLVEDTTGTEVSFDLTRAAEMVDEWDKVKDLYDPLDTFGFHDGDNDNPGPNYIDFLWRDFEKVKYAVNYFVAQTTVDQLGL